VVHSATAGVATVADSTRAQVLECDGLEVLPYEAMHTSHAAGVGLATLMQRAWQLRLSNKQLMRELARHMRIV
jgi:glycerol dehydrogenase-like iron-containing ADH family enzyme